MTNKIFLWIIIVIFLLLDWAALHDIIKGNQPDYWGEYAILAMSVIVFITIGAYLVSQKAKNN